VNSIAAVIALVQSNMLISIPDEETTVIQIDYNTNIPEKGVAVFAS
jgi:hypothetical protein